jgi:hypothetical protein
MPQRHGTICSPRHSEAMKNVAIITLHKALNYGSVQ